MVLYAYPQVDAQFTSVAGDTYTSTGMEFGGDIMEVSTYKSIDNPIGTFSIVMIDRSKRTARKAGVTNNDVHPYWMFRPASLVSLSFNGRQTMVGVIESIKKSVRMAGDGKPYSVYIISGFDLGVLLVNHKIFYSILSNSNLPNAGLMNGFEFFGDIHNDPPGKVIEKIINKWFIEVISKETALNDGTLISPFQFADGDFVYDKLVCKTDDGVPITVQALSRSLVGTTNKTGEDRNAATIIAGTGAISTKTYTNEYPVMMNMFGMQMDLFGMVKQIISPPLNEIFVDTGDMDFVLNGNANDTTVTRKVVGGAYNKAYLVVRPSPFDDHRLGIEDSIKSLLEIHALDGVSIDESHVIDKELMISKNSIPSEYRVTLSGGIVESSLGKQFFSPYHDVSAIQRYGYTPMEFVLSAYDLDNNTNGNGQKVSQVDVCQKIQKKFYSWFRNMDKFFTGSFIVKGNPSARIGMRLDYYNVDGIVDDEYDDGYFYITTVQHKYVYASEFTTTLGVERGVSEKLRKEGFYDITVPKKAVKKKDPIVLNINFAFDSAELPPTAHLLIDTNLDGKFTASSKITLVGWTDHIGSDAYNLDLSQRRAESVLQYMTVRWFNVATRQNCTAIGKGKSKLPIPHDVPGGNPNDRRVEVTIE